MTKRVVSYNIESCRDCPFLETEDGFSTHWHVCGIGHNMKTSLLDLIDESVLSEVDAQLKDWFENKCPLEKYTTKSNYEN